jgi:hypothetical protein
MAKEIAKRAGDLEDPIRTTIISHLRYHLKTYRTTVGSLERSLMLIVQAGQEDVVPSAKATMRDATFTPLKKKSGTKTGRFQVVPGKDKGHE